VCHCVLGKILIAVSHFGAKQSTCCGVPAGRANRAASCWSGMTDIEHSTSSSNEEESYSTRTIYAALLFAAGSRPICIAQALRRSSNNNTSQHIVPQQLYTKQEYV